MDVEVTLKLRKVEKVERIEFPRKGCSNGVGEWFICMRGEGSAPKREVLGQKSI